MSILLFKSAITVIITSFLVSTLSCVTTKKLLPKPEKISSTTYPSKYSHVSTEIKPKNSQALNIPEKGPIKITPAKAILIALENNRSLSVEKMNPFIQKTFEQQLRAEFDPTIEAEISGLRSKAEMLKQPEGYSGHSTSNIYEGIISLKKFFPTGTFLEADAIVETTDSDVYNRTFSSARLGLSATQSLLRGFGSEVNLAQLRQSQIDTEISQYELRGFSEALVAQVETAYWDYALSRRQIEIVLESVKVAKQQIAETQEMIKVGTMAEAELAALQAELASQQQELINARSLQESARLKLLRLLNPLGDSLWSRDVILVHPPVLPNIELDEVQSHVSLATSIRPEINQAKLEIKQKDLEIVRTKNGLLPRMDLFISLGKTGYSDSFVNSANDISEENYDVMIGVNLEYPLFNRDARAQHQRSLLRRDQAEMALKNLTQLIELDVRNAYIEVNRTREQISASTATRRFEEEKLRVETEKFRVGHSTNFFVAQAQRDLLLSKINEVQSVVDFLKALIQFYRLEGSLLERRGIKAPGLEKVE
ncbi:MAG: TolC family protein [Deltaproteobacteria bacterium]|nr:TolC family protein [Deltaproteobacteria bacterium]